VAAIIRSMTPAERDDPKIINGSRRVRIANGSGVTVAEVNNLVDRFFEARKMMKQMAGMGGLPGMRRATKAAKGKKGKKGKDVEQEQVVTTSIPTTEIPTTAIPTTAIPTTAIPTTAIPTTAIPTTAIPTTAIPTTGAATCSSGADYRKILTCSTLKTKLRTIAVMKARKERLWRY